MSNSLKHLNARVTALEARNTRVELDKHWETSLERKIAVAVLTYLFLAAYFGLVLKVNPWINAVVPTVGYLVSTLSLNVIKHLWLHRTQRNNPSRPL